MGSQKMRIWAAALLTLLVIGAIAGAVYAYLSATSGPVNNQMTVAPYPTIHIQETFTTDPDTGNLVKENVCVNVGDPGYAVYVRAAIVITWQDEDGNVYWEMPKKDVHYRLDFNTSDWFQGSDGYYYYFNIVDSGDITTKLITSCYQIGESPVKGYTLRVEIIAQTIQALGTTDNGDIPAVTDAWGIAVDDNKNLVKPTT